MKVEIELKDAPAFIASLVREGVKFSALQSSNIIKITLTGGY